MLQQGCIPGKYALCCGEVLSEVSLRSLCQEAETFCAGKQDMVVSLRVKDRNVPMGVVEDVKEILKTVYRNEGKR